jgi:hypothetical protein
MTDKIEPALSAEDWKYPIAEITVDHGSARETLKPADFARNVKELPILIALANAALPSSDPRKFTREWVSTLRTVADALEVLAKESEAPAVGVERFMAASYLREQADALESYLPPEGT